MSDQQKNAEPPSTVSFKGIAISLVFLMAGLTALGLSWLFGGMTPFQANGLRLLGGISVALGCLSLPSLLRPSTMAVVWSQQLIARLFVSVAAIVLVYAATSSFFQKPDVLPVAQCSTPTNASPSASNSLNIVLAADTVWRPRGGEVRFTLNSDGKPAQVANLRVCFRWAAADKTALQRFALIESPMVRAIGRTSFGAEYGAQVPSLPPAAFFKSGTGIQFTALHLVPVAEMVVEATTENGRIDVASFQVGVSSVKLAGSVTILSIAMMLLLIRQFARKAGAGGSNWILSFVADHSGYADIAQFQLILWTTVIGAGAIFAMSLSGTLLDISSSTLVFIGIASMTALAVRLLGSSEDQPSPTLDFPTGSGPSVVPGRAPRWSDLITVGGDLRDLDLARIQMLILTTSCALFIATEVILTYGRPDIPSGILLILGISNGIYVAGRLPPNTKQARV
jgi:hypothetical protein